MLLLKIPARQVIIAGVEAKPKSGSQTSGRTKTIIKLVQENPGSDRHKWQYNRDLKM